MLTELIFNLYRDNKLVGKGAVREEDSEEFIEERQKEGLVCVLCSKKQLSGYKP